MRLGRAQIGYRLLEITFFEFNAEEFTAHLKSDVALATNAGEWRKQGLDEVVIRRYDVYGTNPKSASLEMIEPRSVRHLYFPATHFFVSSQKGLIEGSSR